MDAALRLKLIACPNCRVQFTPVSSRTIFCSRKCANTSRPIKGPYRKVKVNGRSRLLHRVVKERELGRPLRSDEIVHHRDEIKSNNDPSNLDITTMPAHSRQHMLGNQHARRSTNGG